MFGSVFWVLLLVFWVGEQQFIASGQHLPREIEEGPDGSIIINLGGIQNPQLSNNLPPRPLAILRSAKSRGVATRKLYAGSDATATKPIENYAEEKDEETYDYESFENNAAQKQRSTTMKGKQEPKKAKSKRPTILQWLVELVSSKPSGVGQQQKRVDEEEKKTPGKAFGANSQLFDEQMANDRRPLSTPPNALLDVPIHTPILFPFNSQAIMKGPSAQISEERKRVNGGCREWSDYHSITNAQLTRRRGVVDGRVQKPIESTEPLNTLAEGQASFAVVGPNSSALPLPECFTNEQGMVCCNRVLEDLIFRASDSLQHANVNRCNIEIYSEVLRNLVEKKFQRTFEIIIANGPFAAKVRFQDNLLCETISNSRYVLIYATPEHYTLSPYNVQEPLSS